MNRTDYQRLAMMRLTEAKTLFTARQYPGAYYLAGYAVECALKACICHKGGQYPFPTVIRREEYYTHNVVQLLKTVELEADFGAARGANPALNDNWSTVIQWNEQSRYERQCTRHDARELINTIEDPANGVLAWLKLYW